MSTLVLDPFQIFGDEDINAFKYTNSVSALETITVPANQTNDFIIDWGDGSATEHITTSNPSHEYVDADSYQISINGTMSSFAFNDGGSKLNITSLDQWGNVSITNLVGGFRGCLNMVSVPNAPITGADTITSCVDLFRSTGIINIPSGLFDNNPLVITFRNVFLSSVNIESLPSGLFDNNPLVTSFTGAFQQTGLTSISSSLFFNNPLVTEYANTFRLIPGGVVLPATIFDLSNLGIVTTFNGAFLAVAPGFASAAQDIWNFALSATSVNTYLNQTNISNYADIPNNWKGL